jgi:tetratricopeptide (TPR) repeat protein
MRLRLLVGSVCVAGAMAACGGRQEPPATAPPIADLVSQANRLGVDGKEDEAIALFEQVLARDPRSYGAHYGIGRALDLVGRYDEARAHFTQAIAFAPETDKDQATRMLGIAWTFAGDTTQAATQLRMVFERRLAERSFAGAAEVANELGRVYLEAGDVDRADEWYRTGHDTATREDGLPAWRTDLTDMRWAHAQARIAARRGQARTARQYAATVKKLLDKGGNDDQAIQYPYLLGYVEFYLGHYQPALDALVKADQKDPFILFLAGEASAKLGRHDQAREYYRKVLESTSHAVNNAFARPAAQQRLRAK